MQFSCLARVGLFSALVCASAPAFAQTTAVVEEIYREYVNSPKDSTKTPDQYKRSWYSTKIRAQINRLEAACKKRPNDMCWPDADFLVDGQDFEIKNLKVREVSQAAGKAVVEAKFTNFGDWRTMTFHMVEENGRWVIDQMFGKSKEQPKGYKLTDILKPIPKS